MKTILVIDDDKDIRDAVSKVLKLEGYRVRTACNGEEGLAALRDIPPPELVLLDLMMPVKDGYAYSNEHRQDPLHGAVPIVVMSAAGHMEKSRLGAKAYLRKPLDIDILIDTVKRCS